MTRFFRQWLRNVQKVSIRTKLLWPLLALSVGSVGTVGILSMVVAREAISVMAFDQFETVGQDSPVCSRPSKRVVAFDGANSLLYQKLVGTQNCGSQMPAGGPYLNPADSNKFVKAWIDEGALNN